MFNSRPIRSLLRRKTRTRSTVDPYSTEELADIIEQVTIGFQQNLQWLKELSIFVDFEASEFIEENENTITELEKHF